MDLEATAFLYETPSIFLERRCVTMTELYEHAEQINELLARNGVRFGIYKNTPNQSLCLFTEFNHQYGVRQRFSLERGKILENRIQRITDCRIISLKQIIHRNTEILGNTQQRLNGRLSLSEKK